MWQAIKEIRIVGDNVKIQSPLHSAQAVFPKPTRLVNTTLSCPARKGVPFWSAKLIRPA